MRPGRLIRSAIALKPSSALEPPDSCQTGRFWRRSGFWTVRRLDGHVGVLPLPTPQATLARFPGGDGLRRQPQSHLAAPNKCAIIGRPIRDAVLRLVCGMDLRLHPYSVVPLPLLSRRLSESGLWAPAALDSCTNAHGRRTVDAFHTSRGMATARRSFRICHRFGNTYDAMIGKIPTTLTGCAFQPMSG
jgi:hypothetical protein